MVKSGGEWISSVDLENAIMGHPEVAEAAVVAIAHPKWTERPLACVVPKPGRGSVTRESIRAYLKGKVADWWLPDDVAVIDVIPKTSVGKFDKKVLAGPIQGLHLAGGLVTRFAALLLLAVPPRLSRGRPPIRHLALARRVLRTTPLVDGHNDLPWRIREDSVLRGDVDGYDLRKRTPGHTDLARLRKGMVGAQFWSIYIPGEIRDSGYARVQLEQFDIARRVIARYPEALQWTPTAAAMRRAFAAGRIGSLLGMEGGHAIENSLGALRMYYELGGRYMTLTHNVTLDWADAALDRARHGGLTQFGEEVVREMNRLGMLVDLSHVSPGTMSDALNVTEAPVIFSHSTARALVDHRRNVPDSILARLPKNGGVVMVTFVNSFVSAALKAWEDSGAAARKGGRRPRVTIKDVGRPHRPHPAGRRRESRRDRLGLRRHHGDDRRAGGRLHLPGAVRRAGATGLEGSRASEAGRGERAPRR